MKTKTRNTFYALKSFVISIFVYQRSSFALLIIFLIWMSKKSRNRFKLMVNFVSVVVASTDKKKHLKFKNFRVNLFYQQKILLETYFILFKKA